MVLVFLCKRTLITLTEPYLREVHALDRQHILESWYARVTQDGGPMLLIVRLSIQSLKHVLATSRCLRYLPHIHLIIFIDIAFARRCGQRSIR